MSSDVCIQLLTEPSVRAKTRRFYLLKISRPLCRHVQDSSSSIHASLGSPAKSNQILSQCQSQSLLLAPPHTAYHLTFVPTPGITLPTVPTLFHFQYRIHCRSQVFSRQPAKARAHAPHRQSGHAGRDRGPEAPAHQPQAKAGRANRQW